MSVTTHKDLEINSAEIVFIIERHNLVTLGHTLTVVLQMLV